MICSRLTLLGSRLGERVSVNFQPCWLLELISIHVAKEAVVFFFSKNKRWWTLIAFFLIQFACIKFVKMQYTCK